VLLRDALLAAAERRPGAHGLEPVRGLHRGLRIRCLHGLARHSL
jgi:hypothetical protein